MGYSEEGDRSQELAELKAWLERRIQELQSELERLRAVVRYVDEALAKSSFKRADALVAKRAPEQSTAEEQRERPALRTVRSRSGKTLATLTFTADAARFVLSPELQLMRDHKPFSSFLLRKVLDGFVTQDQEMVSKGYLDQDQAFSYEVTYEGDVVRQIEIRNYRNEARLREIISALRWTLETAPV
ncbi:MAG: hypothetical protein NZ957_00830 [Thaumarchaeota archaeon]|nr:hypothetical protein [Candidatus Calditenuaceae archaeon]MDW8042324.1 hypothetical protein [Nitrososphaerota archaeon]